MNLGIAGIDQVEEIGRGGFAVVFRAWQPAFERNVAIKVVTAGIDELAAQRFERECLAIGALSGHPNIVTVYDVGQTEDGRPYIMMEFLAGGSLADTIRSQGPMAWDDAIAIGVKMCGALESAHRIAVLHRDVKPENILVSRYGEPKLADFGIARIEGKAETRSGLITASPHHAPPEILNGERASIAADVYSLASTLFALITGHGPFDREDDDTIFAIYSRIATDSVPDVRELDVPDSIADVLEHALAKDPATRPQSAAEFGNALQGGQTEAGVAPTALPVEVTPDSAAPSTATRVTNRTASPTAARTGPPPKSRRGETSMAERQQRMKRSFVFTGIFAVLLIGGLVGLLATRGGNSDKTSKAQATTPTTAHLTGDLVDDFSRPASGWQEANDAVGRRKYENGHFLIESVRKGVASLSFRTDAPPVTNSTTEVTATVAPATQGTGVYGPVCRYQNTTGRSFYFGTVTPAGDWGIYRERATETTADVLASGTITLAAGPHRLSFTCNGSPVNLELSIDGRAVGAASDPTPLPDGRSGLVVLSLGDQPFAVDFDDFVFNRL